MTDSIQRVYVLGAGASRFAGYPLASELWNFVRDRSRGEATTNQVWAAVVPALEPLVKAIPDLEELFTHLDRLQPIPGVSSAERDRVDWPRFRPKVVRLIAEAFMNHQHDLRLGRWSVDPASGHGVLEAWGERVDPGDVIVSFNWDLLHDVALFRAKKFHYSNGYGFTCRDGTGDASPVRILKLHGSVNWTQRDENDAEPDIVHKADFFFAAHDGDDVYRNEVQWDQGRKLIIPTHEKRISANVHLARLWSAAGNALRAADEVIVVGYRLNPADADAHQLFAQSISGTARIQVVSPRPSDDSWDSLCTVAGLKRPERILERFEDWVLP